MYWVLIFGFGWWSLPPTDVVIVPSQWVKITGITISCQGSGRVWGTDAFARELDGFAGLGANAVATHPYARIHGNGRVSWRWHHGQAPGYVTRPIREAKARGLVMMMKPHLAYWGSRFSWRGAIEFEKAEDRARFFISYRNWIVGLAKETSQADIFVVGTELQGLIDYEDEWRTLIKEVRKVTKARLTYAANWDVYQRVKFWDALDFIGIQAYFPLTVEQNPSEAILRDAWHGIMGDLEKFSSKFNRQVLFTELGYNRSTKAAKEPWDYHQESSQEAIDIQKLCLKVALEVAHEHYPRMAGVFLWKWFVGAAPHENFYLNDRGLVEIISTAWRQP